MLAFSLVLKVVPMLGGDMQRQIANAHTMFNVTNVFIQIWFIGGLVKIVNKLVPGEDEMLALAQGAMRVVKGEEKAKIYEEETK